MNVMYFLVLFKNCNNKRNKESKNFQPMNMNFGVIIDNLGLQNCKNKVDLIENSLKEIEF